MHLRRDPPSADRKFRNSLDGGLHLFGSDQARAFELPRRVLVARAPQIVLVIKAHPHVVPARIAGFIAEMKKVSVPAFTAALPVWGLIWLLGFKSPPPYYESFGKLAVMSGTFLGSVSRGPHS